jgi:predicted nucleic acid-binding protein
VRERVLDASVVLKWFAPNDPGAQEASRLRQQFGSGELTPLVPSLLYLEILDVAGRHWGWNEVELSDLAAALDDLPFVITEPPLAAVAIWVSRGLTAYDAAYLAVAETSGAPLITDDLSVLQAAPGLVEALQGP